MIRIGDLQTRSFVPSSSGTGTQPTNPQPPVNALGRTTPASSMRRAAEFSDSVGVAVHLTYGGAPYGNRSQVLSAINYLGIKHLRDGWGTGQDDLCNWVAANLRPLGVKFCMVHDYRDWGNNSMTNSNVTASMMLAEHKRTGLINDMSIAEGPNEYDAYQRDDLFRTLSMDVGSTYKADSQVQSLGIKVGSGSWANINNPSNFTAVGDLTGYIDYPNFHPYPGNQYMMNDSIAAVMGTNARYVLPTPSGTPVPIIATEHGFTNGTVDDSYPVMPLAQQVPQNLRIFLEDFRGVSSGGSALDIVRTYKYELADQGTDNTFEDSFGLFDNAWNPKPTATSLRNLLILLADSNASAFTFTPTLLGQTLTGNGTTRSLCMQKADGSWWLAFWQQEATFDGTNPVNPAAISATLTLPASHAVTSYSPQTNTTGTSLGSGTSFTVSSSVNVTLLKIV